jgi:hypothetical protein
MYDNEPKKIQREITRRDFGVSSFFLVYINGFNDGQQDYRFYVSAAGSNGLSATEDGEDYSWDAIWDSEVFYTDFGWVVEMKILTPLCDSQNHKVKHGVKFHEK